MPDVGGVSVGSDLGNTGSGNVGQGPYQLIAPNLGDAVETNINNAIANPGGTLAQVPAAAASAIATFRPCIGELPASPIAGARPHATAYRPRPFRAMRKAGARGPRQSRNTRRGAQRGRFK